VRQPIEILSAGLSPAGEKWIERDNVVNDLILSNGNIVDGSDDAPRGPFFVRVADGRIREVSEQPITSGSATTIDLGGRVLMPGLIDAHVHVIATTPNLGANLRLPSSLIAHRSARLMQKMLMRGFTTVRDLGGADIGLVMAVEEGLIAGPRLMICGKALSQTGGHTDYRGRFDRRSVDDYPDRLGAMGRVCDGVPEMRRAVREEIKGGAEFVKLMANGGVSSPTDPIAFLGFSREEIMAAVEEAAMAQTYVAAHLYTDEAIRRCVELGVWSVEHGNLVTEETARLMAEKGAVVVPTLVTYEALAEDGPGLGLPADSIAKIEDVRGAGLASLEIYRRAGVPIAFGSDLLGDMQERQSEEFTIRGRVLPAHEVIASATSVAAKVLKREGEIGVIAPGAFADLIVVDDDPLKDLSLLLGQGRHMPIIMKEGVIFKNTLT
jgi:imidazolonepropionase-like amidohydrolase